ncbi:MAG: arginase [Pseudomonadota bacterium]
MSTSLVLLGYASGLAANNSGCAEGPRKLKEHHIENKLSSQGLNSHWQAMLALQADSTKDRLIQVAELNRQLAEITHDLVEQDQPFLVIGGDHSSAIGTWSGVSATKLSTENALGLIWIDAHMDSHTFDTTPSGNIHGMPLAALLGYGDVALTEILTSKPKLKPEHLSLIGARSFESEEAALLRRLGVRIYEMPEIKRRGLIVVLQEAIARAKKNTAGFGVSLDLDAIDPNDAPGVGVPEPDGIAGKDLCQALTLLRQEKQLLGLEIVEYNPYLDEDNKTEQLIHKIVLSIFGE